MGQIWVRELTGGLDTRKMPETTKGGALIRARDGHINRGGEFEQRAAFVPVYTLLEGTKGLAAGATSLYAFGHQAAPVMPSGVAYQRLQHPDGSTALVSVLSVDLFSGKLYVVGEFADGSRQHFYDGTRVAAWFDGRGRAAFQVTGGTGSSTLTNLTVNGVEILGGTVTWTDSNSVTAALIAAQINSYTSTPDYTATSVGDVVNIIASTAGAASNGFAIVPTVASGFALTPSTGALADGADVGTTSFQPGDFVKTIGQKVYSVSGPNLHFSGIRAPTGWTTDNVGAGFIDMSAEAAGAEVLKGAGKYQNYVAVFAERVIIVYYVDPDPSLNRLVQVLVNTGTVSGKSITQFGDIDLFYLDESGLRSLRARDASNAAATTDIGVPVDDLIVAKLQALSTEERNRITGLIEPQSNRFWLAFEDEIFVFSYFAGSKVSAWSTYTPSIVVNGASVAFPVDDMVVFDKRVYIRSGDTVYAYGGLGATPTYDATEPDLWFPFLDGEAPTKKKTLSGIDAAVEGLWDVIVALDPTKPTVSEKVARIYETTYGRDQIVAAGEGTHISLRFKGSGTGFKKVSSAVIHYAADGDAD